MSSWGLVSYKVVSYKIKWVYTPLPVPYILCFQSEDADAKTPFRCHFNTKQLQTRFLPAKLHHLHVLILWNVKNNAVYSYRQYYIAKHKTLPACIIISRQPLVHFLSNKEKNKEKGYLKRQVFTSDKVFFYERYKRGL